MDLKSGTDQDVKSRIGEARRAFIMLGNIWLSSEISTTRVDELIKCDRRMRIREIALKLEIPKSTFHETVHDTLGYRKVCARWVPKMLKEDHKLQRVERFCCDPNKTMEMRQTLHSNGCSATVGNILPHTAHSLDLAPSGFHLLGPLKRHLGGMAFKTEGDLVGELKNWFAHLDLGFFRVGIYSLLSRWKKYIDLNDDYVKK
ncbi:histone-lysine N-methyltransferase SETMAR [Elysia marginata]|uniref:Histone-lysine N-methyltransferase SETMAR n=1 Tax=Elysia marginata TaxID=1093978 RepID=A0AAV4JA26_9GAST|nr:histone-lysine N-methyltransferase SETMAR [Elysia marginata]